MCKLAETLTYRVPVGTVRALERLADAEGKCVSDIARSALTDRLNTAGIFLGKAA